ncbi:MAG: sugar kinase [Burkholderiales bacterium]
MAIDVVSLGEPLLEFTQLPGGERRYLQGFGGDTSNMAVAAARQGARVAYVTRLGDDAFGEMFRALWRDEGVDASMVASDALAHTGLYFISHNATGKTFTYARRDSAASRMAPADVPESLIRQSAFFHASGISQAISTSACDAVFHAIGVARDAGVRISYDCNLRTRLWPLDRARAIIEATIKMTDYFFPSLDEAHVLWGTGTPEAIIDRAHRLGAKVVALKLGADGALISDGVRLERIEGIAVDAVDATGAGDCFVGAFLARLSKGDSLSDAGAYANVAAALSTTGYGAIAPLPRPDAVWEKMGRRR